MLPAGPIAQPEGARCRGIGPGQPARPGCEPRVVSSHRAVLWGTNHPPSTLVDVVDDSCPGSLPLCYRSRQSGRLPEPRPHPILDRRRPRSQSLPPRPARFRRIRHPPIRPQNPPQIPLQPPPQRRLTDHACRCIMFPFCADEFRPPCVAERSTHSPPRFTARSRVAPPHTLPLCGTAPTAVRTFCAKAATVTG